MYFEIVFVTNTGTPWYNVYKGSAAAHFLEKLDYDAFAIGNHEFDRGVESFAENFVGNISDNNSAEDTLPILSCNIDASSEPSINGKFKCSQAKYQKSREHEKFHNNIESSSN